MAKIPHATFISLMKEASCHLLSIFQSESLPSPWHKAMLSPAYEASYHLPSHLQDKKLPSTFPLPTTGSFLLPSSPRRRAASNHLPVPDLWKLPAAFEAKAYHPHGTASCRLPFPLERKLPVIFLSSEIGSLQPPFCLESSFGFEFKFRVLLEFAHSLSNSI